MLFLILSRYETDAEQTFPPAPSLWAQLVPIPRWAGSQPGWENSHQVPLDWEEGGAARNLTPDSRTNFTVYHLCNRDRCPPLPRLCFPI